MTQKTILDATAHSIVRLGSSTVLAILIVLIPLLTCLVVPFVTANCGCKELAFLFTCLTSLVLVHRMFYFHFSRLRNAPEKINPLILQILAAVVVTVIAIAIAIDLAGVSEVLLSSISAVVGIFVAIAVPAPRPTGVGSKISPAIWVDTVLIGLITWAILLSHQAHFKQHDDFLICVVIGAVAVHVTSYLLEVWNER